MKMIKLVSMSLIASSCVFGASSLAQKAKTNGLTAIPEDAKALSKLIDPKGTITDEKVALGKQLYFEPRLSKS